MLRIVQGKKYFQIHGKIYENLIWKTGNSCSCFVIGKIDLKVQLLKDRRIIMLNADVL